MTDVFSLPSLRSVTKGVKEKALHIFEIFDITEYEINDSKNKLRRASYDNSLLWQNYRKSWEQMRYQICYLDMDQV